MNGLKDEFAGEIDFFDLDIDKPETAEVREEFDLINRSQYALLDANGQVVRRWFGPLQPTIDQEIGALLRSLEEGG